MSRFKLALTSFVALCLTLPLTAAAQSGEESPGTFKVPGTDTTLKVYGYVQLDATYDFSGRVSDIDNWDWASIVFTQPLEGSVEAEQKEKHLFLTARTSRIGISSSTPTGLGELVARIEGDFNEPNPFQGELATNSTGFRLRHAYGQLGGLLVGQTWSTFTDLGSFPDTVDFNPPGSAVLLRQAMLRYTLGLGPASLALALENPQSLSFGESFDVAPDIIANLTYGGDWGHVSVRGVTHELRGLFPDGADGTDELSKRAFGVGVSGSLKLGGDTLVASAQGGNGIGRYMFNSLVQAGLNTGDEIELWQAVGYHVGFTHVWSPQLRSNIIWSQTFFGSDSELEAAQTAVAGDAQELLPNKRIDQAFVNTFFTIMKNAEVGLEYTYGLRKTFAAGEGKQHRINTLFRFGFY